MSLHTKIALAVIVLAAGLIIWRRHVASISNSATYSPSHNLTAVSSGVDGSSSQPSVLTNTYGSQANSLVNLVKSGDITTQQAADAYDASLQAPPRATQWSAPTGPPAPQTYTIPASGPASESRSGRCDA